MYCFPCSPPVYLGFFLIQFCYLSKKKYIYIYRVLNVLEENELINKIECFEQYARWPLLFLSPSLFSLFSLLSFEGYCSRLLFTQPLNSPSFSLMLLLSYPKSTTTKSRQIPNLSSINLVSEQKSYHKFFVKIFFSQLLDRIH